MNDLNKAIELKPDYYQAYYLRGIMKSKLNDFKGDIVDFNKTIELKPDFADAYYNRGISLTRSDDKEGACLDFNKSIKLGSSKAEQIIKDYCK